jgi:aminomethyltransferase
MSPTLKIGIGLGYVACNYVEIDNEIFIEIRNKKIKAIVSKLPFVKKENSD